MLKRPLPLGFAAVYAALPLYPAFIVLTSVSYPGVSVVPKAVALGVLALVGLLVAYSSALLFVFPAPHSQPVLLPMLAGFAAATLAALAGFDPLRGLLFVGIFGTGILWHCSLLRFYREPNVAETIFWAYLSTGTLAAAAAIAMVVTRTPASLYALQHGRATGTFVLPGELAAYLIVMLPVAYAATREGTSSTLRALGWTAMAVGLAALVLTFSRAGWMGAASAVAFLVAVRSRGSRHGRVVALLSIVAGVLAVVLLFNSHHDPSEDYTRIAIWQTALQIIDRFPLTGVGPFDFPLLYALVHVPDADATAFHAHSIYLTFFAEGGILMLAAFAWLAWKFAAELRARLSRAPASPVLAVAVTAGLVGIAVQGLIDTMSIAIFGLWLPAMGLALAAAGPKKPSTGRPATVKAADLRRAGLLTAALLLCACNPQVPAGRATPSARSSPPHTATAPSLHITGRGSARRPVRIIQQVQNRIEYELIAKSYESKGPQGKARAVFQDAHVTFHDRDGKTMTAVAPQAILDEDADTVTLVNSVHAQTSTGMQLDCDRLVYDRTGQVLRGNGNVVIIDPNGFRGTGSSFESDISLTHMRMQ